MSKQTRVGFFTDLHVAGQAPSSRNDDYTDVILEKLAFCLKRCSETCDLVIFGGDMTHSHKLGNDRLKERLIKVFYDNLRNDQPFLYTYGQHDLRGENLGSREESTTAFVMRMLKLLGKSVVEIPHDGWLKYETVLVSACPRGCEPVSWFDERATARAESRCVSIAVVHHLVTDEKTPWLLDYESLRTSAKNNERTIDVVLSGDLHCGFGPRLNQSGTLFVNPGSVARTSKSSHELTRPVQGVDVVVSETDDGVTCKSEFWAIPHKLAKDVFRESAPVTDDETAKFDQETTITSKSFDDVVSRLSTVRVRQVDIWELLERRAREVRLDGSVLAYLLAKRPQDKA